MVEDACRGDAGFSSSYGENLRLSSFEEDVAPFAKAKPPPRLEELTRGSARRSLEDYDAYGSQEPRGAREDISLVPAGVLELLNLSQRQV